MSWRLKSLILCLAMDEPLGLAARSKEPQPLTPADGQQYGHPTCSVPYSTHIHPIDTPQPSTDTAPSHPPTGATPIITSQPVPDPITPYQR
jgi:hypothetical protein